MTAMRLLANAVLYVVATLVMDLFRSGGSLSLDAHEVTGRAAAGIDFAALFEVVSPITSKWGGARARR